MLKTTHYEKVQMSKDLGFPIDKDLRIKACSTYRDSKVVTDIENLDLSSLLIT